MKKTLIISIAAIAALTSCTKEINDIQPERVSGNTVTIKTAFAESKTAFAENMKSVVWEDTDKMSVIMQTGENLWGTSAEFSKGNGDEFTGTFATPEDGPQETGTNTYFAFYPYDEAISTIAKEEDGSFYKDKNTQSGYIYELKPGIQVGLNNMDHIHVPLFGKGSAEGTEMPEIVMNHIATIFKISVKNPGTEDITIKSVKISNTGGQGMSGKFKLDIDQASLLSGSRDSEKQSELLVEEGTIGAGNTGDFYIMSAQLGFLKNQKGEKIIIEIKTDKDFMTYEKEIVETPLRYTAGTIYTKNLEYVKTGDLAVLEFNEMTTEQYGMNVKITQTVQNFEYNEAIHSVGIWYSNDGGLTKSEVMGEYKSKSALISGKTPMLEVGDYTFGTWIKEEDKTIYSEGAAFTVEKKSPYKFDGLTAIAKKNNVTISTGLTKYDNGDNLAVEEVSEAGIWYSTDGGNNKTEKIITYENNVVTGVFEGLEFQKYTFGAYAVIDGEKWYSIGIEKTLTNEIDLNENSFNLQDLTRENNVYDGKITINGNVYDGVKIGRVNDKNNTMQAAIIMNNKCMNQLTGNVKVEFYAVTNTGSDNTNSIINAIITGNGQVNNSTMIELPIDIMASYTKNAAEWTAGPEDQAKRYTLNLTGIDADTTLKIEIKKDNKYNPTLIWGIRVSQAE